MQRPPRKPIPADGSQQLRRATLVLPKLVNQSREVVAVEDVFDQKFCGGARAQRDEMPRTAFETESVVWVEKDHRRGRPFRLAPAARIDPGRKG